MGAGVGMDCRVQHEGGAAMKAYKLQMAGYARRHNTEVRVIENGHEKPWREVLEAHKNETLTSHLIDKIAAEMGAH